MIPWFAALSREMTHFLTHHGLPILFAVVMIESFGIPLPG